MRRLLPILAFFLAMPAYAQATPTYTGNDGRIHDAQGTFCPDLTKCGSGSGSGSSANVGTNGANAPTSSGQAGGINPAGNLTAVRTDTAGRLLPGQGAPTSTQATTVASTATQLVAGNTGRLAWELQTETALTAPLYLCFVATTTCSATVHDRMIASGSTAGTLYTAPFGFQGAVYYFTTQAGVVLNQTSWAAQ